MTPTYPTRLFTGGSTTTPCVTSAAPVVAASQSPFSVDDALTVSIGADAVAIGVDNPRHGADPPVRDTG